MLQIQRDLLTLLNYDKLQSTSHVLSLHIHERSELEYVWKSHECCTEQASIIELLSKDEEDQGKEEQQRGLQTNVRSDTNRRQM